MIRRRIVMLLCVEATAFLVDCTFTLLELSTKTGVTDKTDIFLKNKNMLCLKTRAVCQLCQVWFDLSQQEAALCNLLSWGLDFVNLKELCAQGERHVFTTLLFYCSNITRVSKSN